MRLLVRTQLLLLFTVLCWVEELDAMKTNNTSGLKTAKPAIAGKTAKVVGKPSLGSSNGTSSKRTIVAGASKHANRIKDKRKKYEIEKQRISEKAMLGQQKPKFADQKREERYLKEGIGHVKGTLTQNRCRPVNGDLSYPERVCYSAENLVYWLPGKPELTLEMLKARLNATPAEQKTAAYKIKLSKLLLGEGRKKVNWHCCVYVGRNCAKKVADSTMAFTSEAVCEDKAQKYDEQMKMCCDDGAGRKPLTAKIDAKTSSAKLNLVSKTFKLRREPTAPKVSTNGKTTTMRKPLVLKETITNSMTNLIKVKVAGQKRKLEPIEQKTWELLEEAEEGKDGQESEETDEQEDDDDDYDDDGGGGMLANGAGFLKAAGGVAATVLTAPFRGVRALTRFATGAANREDSLQSEFSEDENEELNQKAEEDLETDDQTDQYK